MHGKSIALALAIVFMIMSPSIFLIAPSLKKLPANTDQFIYYHGKLGIFNMTTLQLDYIPITITRHIKALEKHGNVLVIREDIVVKDGNGNELKDLASTKIYGIDERTAENIQGYGDLDRIGHWIFPVGIEKKNYLIWNSDLDDACKKGYVAPEQAVATARYMGEDVIEGVKTYRFYGNQSNIYVGNLPEFPEARIYYSGEITAWADVTTGTIIDLHKHVEEFAKFPNLHKIPSNLNTSVILYGNLKMLNQSNGMYDFHNITLENRIWVEDANSCYYMIGSKTIAMDENGRMIKEFCSASRDSVNPYTMEYLSIESDKKGLMTFPIGVKKIDYPIWDSQLNEAINAVYSGSEKICNQTFYIYYQNVSNAFMGEQSIEGFSDRSIKLYYNGSTKYVVEPNSGTIAYLEKKGVVIGDFPNIRSIPENTKQQLKMEGSLWIISQPKRNIEMFKNVSVKNVYFDNGKKVLIIEDNTTTYNKKNGEEIDEASKVEYHGVYADTAEEAKNYGDMERSGLYTFPIGVEKKDYIMWNTEINAPSIARFVREEDHEGIHTYLFEINENRLIYDEKIGGMARYITDTKYWVEPNTGIVIDMKKETVEKINPLQLLIGIQGFFWIDAMKLNIQFSRDTINEAKEKALMLSNLVKFSNKKAEILNISLKTDMKEGIKKALEQKNMIEKLSDKKVKIVDLYYQMDEKSIKDMADKAKKASFMLMLIQIIIPLLLIIIAIALIIYGIRR